MTGRPTLGGTLYSVFKTAFKDAEQDMGRKSVSQMLMAHGVSEAGVGQMLEDRAPSNPSDTMIFSRHCSEMFREVSLVSAEGHGEVSSTEVFTSVLSPDAGISIAAAAGTDLE